MLSFTKNVPLLAAAALSFAALSFAPSPVHSQGAQRTTATYEDWTLSCVIAPGPSSQKSCELVQQQTIQGQPNPVSQITIARATTAGPFKVSIQVPANVWLQAGINLATDEKDLGLAAEFRWCIAARCLADSDVPEAVMNKLASRTEPGRIEYKDASQRDVAIPVSFKGLRQALEARAKE